MSGMDVDNPSDGVERKGRGFASRPADTDVGVVAGYETIRADRSSADRAQRSIEGWIIIVRNLHEEATEEDLQDKFGDYGEIKNLHLNLDRRTGFVKGYALIEYAEKKEALDAIKLASGTELLEMELNVDFAFSQPPASQAPIKADPRSRGRSQSPPRRKPLVTRID
ncbi:hypothetical protein MVLG_04261 [Microbotryum lychnidis-dioicae p1A1 Lamole]|uniref:RRM domain-containing protein n=1 Tax=Microbotryum lychnidis-dioicae (strain p1A1 Lamole / MvSl-1064) TaxID=683840 RepID=U5HAN9_USTV1|nr:hypothetical protein MVLG_04261 [Microbotryum lychnidis-dioicae p1A1 Lamole]|eukprot:KDE05346.1 hypothetical protein MVLG_04261 [Microbotryum lychnidis-dioicae p1A1 Lamole]